MNLIQEISSIKEYNNLFNNNPNNLFIIYLYSDNCNTCEKLKPKLNGFLNNRNNNTFLFKINVDISINLTQVLDITTYPVFRVYKNKILIQEIFGTYDNIIDILESIN